MVMEDGGNKQAVNFEQLTPDLNYLPISISSRDMGNKLMNFITLASDLSVATLEMDTQGHDNVTTWDIGSQCRRPDLPVRQHSKVTMSAHCSKSIPIPV